MRLGGDGGGGSGRDVLVFRNEEAEEVDYYRACGGAHVVSFGFRSVAAAAAAAAATQR